MARSFVGQGGGPGSDVLGTCYGCRADGPGGWEGGRDDATTLGRPGVDQPRPSVVTAQRKVFTERAGRDAASECLAGRAEKPARPVRWSFPPAEVGSGPA